jgi:hypothetical protein
MARHFMRVRFFTSYLNCYYKRASFTPQRPVTKQAQNKHNAIYVNKQHNKTIVLNFKATCSRSVHAELQFLQI